MNNPARSASPPSTTSGRNGVPPHNEAAETAVLGSMLLEPHAAQVGIEELERGERVALNFLQRLCGIATLSRSFVKRTEGTKTKIDLPDLQSRIDLMMEMVHDGMMGNNFPPGLGFFDNNK